jgi:biopolymer transport protein TolR
MALSMGNNNNNRRRRARSQPFAEINITPMVDVMLVLLVIFMVAAPMMTTGVSVDLPQTKASPVSGQDEPLSISVTAEGKVYVQKQEVPLEGLQQKLKAIAGEKKDTRIFVRGDKNIDYGKIMAVVGEVNAAGFGKVALITDVSNAGGDEKRK